jgi:hypothetical protein
LEPRCGGKFAGKRFQVRAPRRALVLKALSVSIAKKYFGESAFLQFIALTRHQRAAQTRSVE